MRRDLQLPTATAAPPRPAHAPAGAALPTIAFRVPIDAMLDAVLVVAGRDLTVVAANAAACRLLVGSPAEICGRAIARFLPTPEDRGYWAEAAAGSSDSIDSESHLATLVGSFVPVVRRVGPFETEDGSLAFVVGLRDRGPQLRTERRLEAAVADLRATLESTCDGLLVVDLAGNIRHVNRRLATVWRMPAELLLRRDDDAVFEWMRRSVDDPAGYMRRLARIEALAPPEARDLLHLRNGTTLERVTTQRRLHDRPSGRVYAFREVEGAIEADDDDRVPGPPVLR